MNGGGIYLVGANNYLENCQCNSNNTDNFDTNTGGSGNISAGNGAGVGGGGSGLTSTDTGGSGTCYTVGGGIFLQGNTTVVNSCGCIANNVNNLLGNSSVGNGSGSYPGVGTCYTDGAGMYIDAASDNMIDACDMIINWTSGIVVGKYNNYTLTDNLVSNCTVNGSTNNTQSTTLNGIVSYAQTTTNIFNNNVVRNCLRGFVAAAVTTDKFLQNTAYNNCTQYSTSITNTALITDFTTIPGVNIKNS